MPTMDAASPILIVGNSRSGTTLMGRILMRHPRVHTFGEIHFPEQMWLPGDDRERSEPEAADLAARLLCIVRDGYLTQGDWRRFRPDAAALLAARGDPRRATDVYYAVLLAETERAGKSVPVDKTPRNLFYVDELLELFPRARVVNMVRDPRDVLLSQKNKWRRRFLGGVIPLREAARAWVNYHPVTISRLWRSAVLAGERFGGDPRVMTLRFEDLVGDPEASLARVLEFLKLDPAPGMLDVPAAGSSQVADDPEARGLRRGRLEAWKQGGLSAAEIRVCERINADLMARYGYQAEPRTGTTFGEVLTWATLPARTGLAVLVNLKRARSMITAIRRRLRAG